MELIYADLAVLVSLQPTVNEPGVAINVIALMNLLMYLCVANNLCV